jgi:hypothetical protein
MFLRCAGELLAWITIFAVGFGMGFLGYLIQTYGQKEYPEGDNTRQMMEITAYIIWGLTGLYFLIICCMWGSIKISVRVLRVAAKVVAQNLRVILVPVSGIILILCWVFFFIYGLLWLMSTGEIVSKEYTPPLSSTSYPYKSFEWSDNEKYMIWFSLFSFFWVCAFLMACTEYV